MITITFHAEKEEYSPEHGEKTQGYAKGFAEAVREQLKKSRTWGWCTVRVDATAKFGPPGNRREVTGSAYLGECSYSSEEDFVLNSGYTQDKIEEALADLKKNIARQVVIETPKTAIVKQVAAEKGWPVMDIPLSG
jgi:hypothetical protein